LIKEKAMAENSIGNHPQKHALYSNDPSAKPDAETQNIKHIRTGRFGFVVILAMVVAFALLVVMHNPGVGSNFSVAEYQWIGWNSSSSQFALYWVNR
jgi:hypothetical protein